MFQESFDENVVIITGSSPGIGQAAAISFAKAGASVIIHRRSSDDGLKKTLNLILDQGISKDKIHTVKGSVTEDSTLKALVDVTISKFGEIDILLNNVGLTKKRGFR